MEKIKIEKGTVQETLLIPLYGRKCAMDLYPDLFMDHDCQALFDRIDFTVPDNMKGMLGNIGCIMGATRQYDMASACRAYLKKHPNACVVNLGCGLDTTFRQVDFPDTIAIRNELLGNREREFNIACDLNDISWFDQIDFHPEDGIVFFASGVFYYFKKTDVEKLFTAMAEHFPGGKLVFDATKKKGLKSMLKTWLKGFEMKDINVYFSVDDVHTLKEWSGHISSAVSNPYLTGYRPLDKRYGFITNIVFRYLDRSKMCQIIELKFD